MTTTIATLILFGPYALVHRVRPWTLNTFQTTCGISCEPKYVRSGPLLEVSCLWCVAERKHWYKTS